MKILIAGASGFIGTNLVAYLENKYEVQPLSLRENNWHQQIDSPNVFINLIGKAHDHKGTATQKEYDYANIELTRELFRCFLNTTASTFIHISSLAAVEETESATVIDDNSTANPSSFYGKSKKAAEDYLLAQHLPVDKKLIILRPTMVHGPGDKGNLALLFKFVNHGIPYPLGAFHNKRSFLGIDNLCFIINELIAKEVPSGIYFLADDEPISTTEIIKMIASLSGKKIRILKFPEFLIGVLAKLGDLIKLPLNTNRLKKLTANLVVSNEKIKDSLQIKNLPFSTKKGLEKTIKSFLNK